MTRSRGVHIPVSRQEVRFEGLSEKEILEIPPDAIKAHIFIDKPLVFTAGSATILGSFRLESNRLVIELAQIEGGGEGVLISLACLARRYAKLNGLSEIEWVVHAVSCAKPNLKLRRVLKRRGFEVKDVEGIGQAYYLLESL